MEQSTTRTGVRKQPFTLAAAAVLFVAAYFTARLVLQQEGAAASLRITTALLPVLPFAWMLWIIVRTVRGLDELEQRIQLEALAVAFPLTLILLMTLGLLELAVTLPPEDLSYRHVWAMLPVMYVLGLALARRRYR